LIVLLAVSAAGAAYLALALVRVVRFARRGVPARTWSPSITVLKPLYGAEPGLYENLASFCDQSYSDYELVLCVHAESDPAKGVVERVVRDFPACRIRTVYGENAAMANPKIANLAKPGAEPQGELIVLADSDIRVGRDYLDAIAASFTSERTGAVTCLYGGIPVDAFAAHLGALHVEDEFAPSVLVALALGKLSFCMGATMAVRRAALEAIGGIEALGPHLADDHALGRLVSERGFEVELSRYVVRTTVTETTLARLWEHELRWARTNFTMAPAGYVFSFLMYAMPFAALYALAARSAAAAALLLLVAALRYALHYAARATFANARRDEPWLVPLRDLFSLGVWGASLVTRTVSWRGARHRM
jgi:ceramide glucosyltransferase